MFLRSAVVLAAVAAAGPVLVGTASAESMNAEQARRFVVGKFFSFTCFEGTAGTGRIFSDGSVAGVIKIQGTGPTRFMHLPPGTLFAKGDAVCSSVKGAFFNPCFNLTRMSDKAFRGAISGFSFAYCDFVRGGRGEPVRTAATSPEAADPAATPRRLSIRRSRPVHSETATTAPAAPAAPVAAPTQPVTSEPLKPATEQPAIRSTITP